MTRSSLVIAASPPVGQPGFAGQVGLATGRVAVVGQHVDGDRLVDDGVGEVVASQRWLRQCLEQHVTVTFPFTGS
jgi:hypothetical protein